MFSLKVSTVIDAHLLEISSTSIGLVQGMFSLKVSVVFDAHLLQISSSSIGLAKIDISKLLRLNHGNRIFGGDCAGYSVVEMGFLIQ